MRIVGLSASLANAREVGEWMGMPIKSLFNFSPKIRPIPLEISIQTFDQNSYPARLMAMAKPTYNAISRHSDGKPVIVIVPSRRQALLTAIDIMAYNESQEGSSFLGSQTSGDKIETVAATLREPALQQTVPAGVGFLHRGMVDADKGKIKDLFDT